MNFNPEKYLRIFFNKFYKDQHPEAALRYIPVISVLKNRKMLNSKILEVGSGSLGITPYLKKPIDAIDVDFSGPQTSLLNKINGTADNLPFRKNSYDVLICADTLEHIKKTQREKVIEEMMRVAKKLIIIVVPTGSLSQEQDKKLDAYYQKIFNKKNDFLSEHVQNGLPSANEILVIFDRVSRKLNKKTRVSSRPLLNLKIREVLMKTWITKNKYVYYLYLKGYLILVPLLTLINWGNCYRRLFVVEFINSRHPESNQSAKNADT